MARSKDASTKQRNSSNWRSSKVSCLQHAGSDANRVDYSKHIDTKRYEALQRWTDELTKLHKAVVVKAAQTGPTPAFSSGATSGMPPEMTRTRSFGGIGMSPGEEALFASAAS